VEIQKSLADLAWRNVRLNRLEDKISVLQQDLLEFKPRGKFDVVFSNPPYIKKHTGQLNVSAEKSIAKHELKCDIFDIMLKTSELLRKRGRAYFIFTVKRKDDFIEAVKKTKLKMKTIRYVFPRRDSASNLFLSECDFFSKGEICLPPFIVYDEKGNYTSEAQEIFSGRLHATNP
jgi:tRNA1Val (adenine37-N6)-methyltransferase